MLTGQESLIRLIGKRRRLYDHPLSSNASSPSQSHPDESFDRKTEDNGESELSLDNNSSGKDAVECDNTGKDVNVYEYSTEWVTCPVCEKSIHGSPISVNSHLDLCLNRGRKRKFVQRTLFQLNFCNRSVSGCSKRTDDPGKAGLSKMSEFMKHEEAINQCRNDEDIYDLGASEQPVELDSSSTSKSHELLLGEDDINGELVNHTNAKRTLSPCRLEERISNGHSSSEVCDASDQKLETFVVTRKFGEDVKLKQGEQIYLSREPENVKDANAIKVLYSSSDQTHLIGYLPRELAKHLSPLIDKCYVQIDVFTQSHRHSFTYRWVQAPKRLESLFASQNFQGCITSIPGKISDAIPITLTCQNLLQKGQTSSTDLQCFDSLWPGVVEAAKSGRAMTNTRKYQLNFHIMLKEVLSNQGHLFADDERQLLEAFGTLSDNSQRLFIRLYSRKGPWFRVSHLSYPEVSDVTLAIQELCASGYIYCWDRVSMTSEHILKEVLDALLAPELREILKTSYPQKCNNSKRRSELCATLVSLFFDGTCRSLPDMISRTAGACVCVTSFAEVLLWRIQRLFFLNGEQDLSAFLLVDLGVVKYPMYTINISRKVFPDRSELLAYEEAIRVAQIMVQSLEVGDMDSVLRCIKTSTDFLCCSQEDRFLTSDEPFQAFWFRFSATWVYSKVATLGVSVFESELRYLEAVELLRQLLNRISHDRKRGYWTLRLSIDLEHLGRLEDSLFVAEDGLIDPWVRSGSRIAIQRRVLRLGKPPRRWKLPEFAKSMKKKIKEVYVVGRPLNCKIGSKSIFYGLDGDQCGVEELALQYYAGEGGGWKGIHSECGVWITLFGLLMWDVIFADVPDVFRNKFQTAPLDLDCDSFYFAREKLIEAQLEKIEKGMGISIITASWESHFGTSCRCVNWELLTLSDLQIVVSCIPAAPLASLCRLLAQDYRSWSSGMPDLLLWRVAEKSEIENQAGIGGKCKLVEVKGPNDRLSEQQRAWMLVLMDCGFDAEVCKVSPKDHK